MSGPAAALSPIVLPTRAETGAAAAQDIARALREAVAERGHARVVFAAAPSQQETLDALVALPNVPWEQVDALHMDEYVGLPEGAPERFAQWLRRNLFDRVRFRSVDVLDPGTDPGAEAARYAQVLNAGPIDLVVLGIGVNGHIAFNDPGVADFDDPQVVKIVELDEECRGQQVQDGCFAQLADVPRTALTLTVPTLLSGRRLFCIVPGQFKAEAVRATFTEPVSTQWPSTALRSHPDCQVYLDAASAALLSS